MSGFTFRFVSEAEAGVLTEIHENCFPRYWDRQAFTDFFSVRDTFACLVEYGDDFVKQSAGMMVYRVAFEQADVLTIAVRREFRKKGIARKLLDSAMLHCVQMGVKKLFLEVEVGNEPAIKLYESGGFKHVGRRKLYYKQIDGSLTDALVMEKRL